jgi:proteasome assembly chaperone (PAC2) family protein
MILARKNIYFGLAIAWGLFGIITKQNISVDSLNDPVVLAAWAGIGVIGLLCIVQLVRNLHYKKPREIYPSASMPLK